MSDKAAFEKWAKSKGYSTRPFLGIYDEPKMNERYEGWQAAQAQVGSVSKNQISEVIFGWGLRNDDGYNLSLDDTDDIAEDILKQAAQAQAVCPHIVSGGEGTSWCRLAAKPQVNQQLLELLKQAASYTRHNDYDWDVGFMRDVEAAIAAAQEQV
jgi:hypothetical protein